MAWRILCAFRIGDPEMRDMLKALREIVLMLKKACAEKESWRSRRILAISDFLLM